MIYVYILQALEYVYILQVVDFPLGKEQATVSKATVADEQSQDHSQVHGGCTIKGWLRLSGDLLRIPWDFTALLGPPGTTAQLVYFALGEFYGLWQIYVYIYIYIYIHTYP